jgi:hypothetical protein
MRPLVLPFIAIPSCHLATFHLVARQLYHLQRSLTSLCFQAYSSCLDQTHGSYTHLCRIFQHWLRPYLLAIHRGGHIVDKLGGRIFVLLISYLVAGSTTPTPISLCVSIASIGLINGFSDVLSLAILARSLGVVTVLIAIVYPFNISMHEDFC